MHSFINNNRLTLILLRIGYFVDFYDLSLMGAAHNDLIRQQFAINDQAQVQQTYLLISSFQTIGIFIGAVLFGYLGDRVGRASAIKYSILIYSLATIAAVYTHSLPVFIGLRLIAYIGLAAEFSLSTVLIAEMFPAKQAHWGTAILYSFGVLGGITATYIATYSWQVMFLVGGSAGLVLYVLRRKIHESVSYLYAKHNTAKQSLGNLRVIFSTPKYRWQFINYLLIILPFYAVISMMFIFPQHIIKDNSLSIAHGTQLLLIGFFIGNIISSLLSAIINNIFKNYSVFLLISLPIFLVTTSAFKDLDQKYLEIYGIFLGLIGGGYPITWAQQIARSYPVEIRGIASSSLFALGRASGLIFNALIALWVADNTFVKNSFHTAIVVFGLALIGIILNNRQPLLTNRINTTTKH